MTDTKDVERVNFTPYGMVAAADGYYVSFIEHERVVRELREYHEGYREAASEETARLHAELAKQQVGEVQGDRTQLVALIVRSCCESEPSHPDNPDTVCINVNDLEAIVSAQLGAVVMDDDPIPAIAARQPKE